MRIIKSFVYTFTFTTDMLFQVIIVIRVQFTVTYIPLDFTSIGNDQKSLAFYLLFFYPKVEWQHNLYILNKHLLYSVFLILCLDG